MRKILTLGLCLILTMTILASCGQTSRPSRGDSDNIEHEITEKPATADKDQSSDETDGPGKPNEASIPNSKEPIKYNLGYDDNRILECSIDVDDYFFEKNGEWFVDLEKMIADAGWEVAGKKPGIGWIPSARYYREDNIAVVMVLSGNTPYQEPRYIVTGLTVQDTMYNAEGEKISADTLLSRGFQDATNTNSDVYIVSTNQGLVVDYNAIVIFAYCLDHYPNGTELPVEP